MTGGGAPCCPRAASGHAAAAPPMSVMKSRRFMPIFAVLGILSVMAGLGPAIHVFAAEKKKGVDARNKSGHDGLWARRFIRSPRRRGREASAEFRDRASWRFER